MTTRGKTVLGWVLLLAAVAVLALFVYQSGTYNSRLNKWEASDRFPSMNFQPSSPMPQKPLFWPYGLGAAGLAIGGVVTLSAANDDKRRLAAGTSPEHPVEADSEQ